MGIQEEVYMYRASCSADILHSACHKAIMLLKMARDVLHIGVILFQAFNIAFSKGYAILFHFPMTIITINKDTIIYKAVTLSKQKCALLTGHAKTREEKDICHYRCM